MVQVPSELVFPEVPAPTLGGTKPPVTSDPTEFSFDLYGYVTHTCALKHTHTDTDSKKTISESGKTWSLRMLVTLPQDPGSISQNSHGSSHLCNPSSRESDSL